MGGGGGGELSGHMIHEPYEFSGKVKTTLYKFQLELNRKVYGKVNLFCANI